MSEQGNQKNISAEEKLVEFKPPFNVNELIDYKVMKMFFTNEIKAPAMLMEKIKKIDIKDRLFFDTIELNLFALKIEVNDEMMSIQQAIEKEYKRYKKMTKYMSDDFEKRDINFFYGNDSRASEIKKPDCSLATFKKFLLVKDGAPCFTWIHHLREFAWIDKAMINPQFKKFKQAFKEGKAKVLEGNNTTQTLDKKEWYSLVITPTHECDICLGSMNLFSFYVSGYVYWFNIKENRDSMYKYLIKQ